jgi:two-component system, LytTR family, response regulator
MTHQVVIIEDEKQHQETLTSLLQDHFPGFKVTGISTSVEEGREMLNHSQPDLVFMDVLLPPHTSFDLISSLEHIPFEIIFTTSFEEFAVKAFRLSAVDYLIKPIVLSELKQALDKFLQKKSTTPTTQHIKTLLENLHALPAKVARIALPTLNGFIFVAIQDIIRCESDNTYTTFFTTDKKKIVVSKTLKDCEHLLQDYRFFRIHNSHVVNLDYISEYIKGDGGLVKMTDGSHIDVSRRRKDEFLRVLKKG